MVLSDFHVGLAEDPQNKKEIWKSIRKVKMNETEKENVKEAEEEDEERHLGERAKKKKKKKKQKKKKERGAARRSARSSSGERRRAAAAAAGRGERSDICDFSFFSTAGVSEPRRSHSEPCQSRVGEAKKKKKKETLAGHRNQASRTRTGVRHVSDTDTTPKMACPCNLGKIAFIGVVCYDQ